MSYMLSKIIQLVTAKVVKRAFDSMLAFLVGTRISLWVQHNVVTM